MWGSCLAALAARKCFEDVPRQPEKYLVFTFVKSFFFDDSLIRARTKTWNA